MLIGTNCQNYGGYGLNHLPFLYKLLSAVIITLHAVLAKSIILIVSSLWHACSGYILLKVGIGDHGMVLISLSNADEDCRVSGVYTCTVR